jgi:hypothetical protein
MRSGIARKSIDVNQIKMAIAMITEYAFYFDIMIFTYLPKEL